mmetsp:Transcript_65108/g.75681  ORF Transcript_65108/g.75681 Transcript_65108/m.75681 type:complete len:413 (+) Transcript_65108:60-1298(+)
MDDPDEPPAATRVLNPFLLGAFQHFRNASMFNFPQLQLPNDNAALAFMIQLDAAYRQQLEKQKSANQNFAISTIPKIESSEHEPTAEKKVKPTFDNQFTNGLSQFMQTDVQQPMAFEIKEEEKENQALQRQLEANTARTTRENSKENDGKVVNDATIALKLEHFQQANSQKEPVSKPAAKIIPDIMQLNNNLENSGIDKKDLKKFEKFEGFLAEYLKKLGIQDAAVERKYHEILRIVIPKLATTFKSKPFEAIAAAILLYACREVQCPIAVKQIIQASNSQEKLVNKCIFSIKEILPNKDEIKLFKADEFILKIGDKLLLSDIIKQTALRMEESVERLNLGKSNHPATVACCCIKFACALSEEDRSFEMIAEAAGINKMTLRSIYRELYPDRFRFIASDGIYSKSVNDLPSI